MEDSTRRLWTSQYAGCGICLVAAPKLRHVRPHAGRTDSAVQHACSTLTASRTTPLRIVVVPRDDIVAPGVHLGPPRHDMFLYAQSEGQEGQPMTKKTPSGGTRQFSKRRIERGQKHPASAPMQLPVSKNPPPPPPPTSKNSSCPVPCSGLRCC